MEAKDWLMGIEKKLVIVQCMDREKVLFVAHQLFGMVANWWEAYCNTHAYVDLSMSVNEYINSFIQLSRYAPDDINTNEKK
jgi:hypothetical protein